MTVRPAFSSIAFPFLEALSFCAVLLLGCSSSSDEMPPAENEGDGGASATASGGAATGGTSSQGTGAQAPGSGGDAQSSGGSPTASGGKKSGGGPGADGGTPGRESGGTSGGGTSQSSGGQSSGGQSNGGQSSGGSGSGTGGQGALPEDITVWLAGDSTVANGNTPCPRGWGAEFEAFFNDEVTVANRAVGGRSVRTWLYDVQDTTDGEGECALALDGEGAPVLQVRWREMLEGMKQGDFLLIQFGINDGDPSCPRHVGGTAFKEHYAMMVRAALERGAQPVFITPVSMVRCDGSSAVGSRGFLTETADVGSVEEVPILDLHSLSVELYNELGFCPLPAGHSDVSASTPGEVGAFFCDDHTHFDQPGAQRIAQVVVDALVEQGLALGRYVKE